MNVLEGLQEIRERLVDNDADPATLATVDAIIRRAALPAAAGATGQSRTQLVRMLQRQPQANNNIAVYNDLLKLEEQLVAEATEHRERVAAEERHAVAQAEAQAKGQAQALQKNRKYYKELKQKERG